MCTDVCTGAFRYPNVMMLLIQMYASDMYFKHKCNEVSVQMCTNVCFHAFHKQI